MIIEINIEILITNKKKKIKCEIDFGIYARNEEDKLHKIITTMLHLLRDSTKDY